MESSYGTQLRLSMGPALTQQSKCTYETRDLKACTRPTPAQDRLLAGEGEVDTKLHP